MRDKDQIKKELLEEMSKKLDDLFDDDHTPKDLYETELAISKMGNELERKTFEKLEEYKQKTSKKKLSKM